MLRLSQDSAKTTGLAYEISSHVLGKKTLTKDPCTPEKYIYIYRERERVKRFRVQGLYPYN